MRYDKDIVRRNMITNQIQPLNIKDSKVLEAIYEIPREEFVPKKAKAIAYIDKDIPLNTHRVMLKPSTVARMIELADVKENHQILNLGCSTGYTAAVLSKLAKKVIAVESDKELSSKANLRLHALGIDNTIIISGNMEDGHEEGGQYDRIFINGAVEEVPELLISQLKEDGILVTLICNQANIGTITVVKKQKRKASHKKMDVVMARLLPGFKKKSKTTTYQIK